jgi:CubicO group peptidase (beta-lactamase class C family)
MQAIEDCGGAVFPLGCRPMRLFAKLTALFSFTFMAMSNEHDMDKIFAAFTGTNTPGASLMVIQNGRPVFAKGYGMADVAAKIKCTPDTNFRLASVTKQFTAMSIMILAERGKLSLSDSIVKFFPDFPAYGKAITVRQLLTHHSGLLDYEDLMPPDAVKQVKDKDVLELLKKQNKTAFPVGSKFAYSNTGYAFLALIVEKVSGLSYAEFLKTNIFGPLGMNHSVAFEDGISTVPNRAYGYEKTDTGFIPRDQSSTSAVLGDGGIYSSVSDLFKWDQALYTEKLVSKKMLHEAFTAESKVSDMGDSGYGFGWYIGKDGGDQHVWHYGSTCGFNNQIDRYPAKQLTVIILTNRDKAGLKELGPQVAALYQ